MVALSVAAEIGMQDRKRRSIAYRAGAYLAPTAVALSFVLVVTSALMARHERRVFVANFTDEFKGSFVCPTVERWPALSVEQRSLWHAYFRGRGFAPFEKSAACYVAPAGVSAWDVMAKLPDSKVWAAGRSYGAILCPKADRLAVAGAEDIARWKSIGAALGPAIPESNLCFDP